MDSKIAIVTDSTAYIPKELVKKYGITVAPQVLVWNGETFQDGVDINPTEFYTRLANASVLPTTSQVAVPTFRDIFSKLHQGGKEILTILISDQLSKSVNSAELARQLVPEANIEIINSKTVAMELGFHVLAAVRAAESGASLSECKRIAEEAQQKSGVLFVVDTLEFLHRGGRIGGASRFLGTALQLKPLLEVREGRVEPIERIRTKSKAFKRLVQMIEDRVNELDGEVRIATLHANAFEDAKDLMQEMTRKLSPIESIYSEVSPVVGTHCGPGTVGIAYMVD